MADRREEKQTHIKDNFSKIEDCWQRDNMAKWLSFMNILKYNEHTA